MIQNSCRKTVLFVQGYRSFPLGRIWQPQIFRSFFTFGLETLKAFGKLKLTMDVQASITFKKDSHTGEDDRADLTAIKWAHAVNSQKILTEALNSNIDFIEADIVMGKVNDSGNDMPIMAHPPSKSSDLSLDSFLSQIKIYNDNHTDKMKGVKLDFKSIEVFEGALQILKQKIPEMKYPIWLNADIIKGPVNETKTIPVNPEKFLAACAQFEKAVLSIGWTTNWSSTLNNGSYTFEQTSAMLEIIQNCNVTKTRQSITFPVRAGIAANSLPQLQKLLNALESTNKCTLTLWSSQNDFVDVEKLRKFILTIGTERVYIDVPEELSKRLDLSSVNLS